MFNLCIQTNSLLSLMDLDLGTSFGQSYVSTIHGINPFRLDNIGNRCRLPFVYSIIIDIIRCSYLILCHLLYNIFNMIEISTVYNNVSSNTI